MASAPLISGIINFISITAGRNRPQRVIASLWFDTTPPGGESGFALKQIARAAK
jgi:hypothetical protein